ncbi:MAG: response regulator [Nannocystaceae bacterium]
MRRPLFPVVSGWIVAVGGALVLIGWIADVAVLKTLLPNRASMKANTAACFVLTGLALVLSARGGGRARLRGARALLLIVAAIGVVTIVDYAAGTASGLDRLLFVEPPGAPLTPYPGRMGLNTALAFVLLAAAIAATTARRRALDRLAEALATGAMLLTVLAGLAYLYAVPVETDFLLGQAQMAVHTSTLFLVLGAGALASAPEGRLRAVLASSGPGGLVARTLLPTHVVVLVLLGALALYGQSRGWFFERFTVAFGVTASIGLLTIAVIGLAERLASIDAERRAAQASFESTARRQRLLLENIGDGVITVTGDGRILDANQRALEITGLGPDRAEWSEWADTYVDADRGAAAADLQETALKERRLRRSDGSTLLVETHARALGEGEVLVVLRDVSARRRLEDQLRHSQKLEAIGRLSGGVAHDFNNLLMVILAGSESVLSALPPDHPCAPELEEVLDAGNRGAALTRQLLAFSRQEIREPKRLAINEVVRGAERLLARLLGEDVELRVRLADDAGSIRADRGQIERILMNLAVNARDAMPRGGTLTIETSLVELDDDYAGRHTGVRPGTYVQLVVTDTGVGMDEATRSRIFDPFFTTKGVGEGTGLGLANVFGIVKQSGGSIYVYSEVGLGATFKIYLPRAADGSDAPPTTSTDAPPTGSGTILVIEDDAPVRRWVTALLERGGYRVIAVDRGAAAIEAAARLSAPLDLVLTDVVMPGLGGRETVDALRERHPEVAALFMSGYTADAVLRRGVEASRVAFLQKPFTTAALLRKVREVLDDRGRGHGSAPG